jgi:hypothetical protein
MLDGPFRILFPSQNAIGRGSRRTSASAECCASPHHRPRPRAGRSASPDCRSFATTAEGGDRSSYALLEGGQTGPVRRRSYATTALVNNPSVPCGGRVHTQHFSYTSPGGGKQERISASGWRSSASETVGQRSIKGAAFSKPSHPKTQVWSGFKLFPSGCNHCIQIWPLVATGRSENCLQIAGKVVQKVLALT